LGKNPYNNSSEILSNMLRFEPSADIKRSKSRYSQLRDPSYQSKQVYDYYRTHQFTVEMKFNPGANHTFEPSCAEYNVGTQHYINSTNCKVLHYTPFNVTCGCSGIDYLDPSSVYSRRSLASSNSMGSVQLTSAGVYSNGPSLTPSEAPSEAPSQSPGTTLSVNPKFNAPKGKPAIVTISTLIVVVLIAYSYFYLWDYQDKYGLMYSPDDDANAVELVVCQSKNLFLVN